MKHHPRGWLALGMLLAAVTMACASAGHRQTAAMESSRVVKVSAAELRARVDDLAERLSGRIEEAADAIRERADGPAVRRNALLFKIEGVPAVYAAAFRADPLEAALDVWGFSFQLQQYLAEGRGRDIFGPQQELALECAQGMLVESDAVARRITTGPEAFAATRERVIQWARAHPIERTLVSRPSIAAYMSDLRAEHDAFVVVGWGAVSDRVEQLTQHLNTYAAQLPSQARWQAELLISDSTGAGDLAGALADVHDLGTTARHADELMGDLPGLVDSAAAPMREAIAAERRAVLAGVNAQRLETQAFVTSERLATLAALRDERGVLLAALHEERVSTLKEIDAIKTRAVELSVVGLHDVVDYALWRIALMVSFLMVVAALLAVVGYRLTLGRDRHGS